MSTDTEDFLTLMVDFEDPDSVRRALDEVHRQLKEGDSSGYSPYGYGPLSTLSVMDMPLDRWEIVAFAPQYHFVKSGTSACPQLLGPTIQYYGHQYPFPSQHSKDTSSLLGSLLREDRADYYVGIPRWLADAWPGNSLTRQDWIYLSVRDYYDTDSMGLNKADVTGRLRHALYGGEKSGADSREFLWVGDWSCGLRYQENADTDDERLWRGLCQSVGMTEVIGSKNRDAAVRGQVPARGLHAQLENDRRVSSSEKKLVWDLQFDLPVVLVSNHLRAFDIDDDTTDTFRFYFEEDFDASVFDDAKRLGRPIALEVDVDKDTKCRSPRTRRNCLRYFANLKGFTADFLSDRSSDNTYFELLYDPEKAAKQFSELPPAWRSPKGTTGRSRSGTDWRPPVVEIEFSNHSLAYQGNRALNAVGSLLGSPFRRLGQGDTEICYYNRLSYLLRQWLSAVQTLREVSCGRRSWLSLGNYAKSRNPLKSLADEPLECFLKIARYYDNVYTGNPELIAMLALLADFSEDYRRDRAREEKDASTPRLVYSTDLFRLSHLTDRNLRWYCWDRLKPRWFKPVSGTDEEILRACWPDRFPKRYARLLTIVKFDSDDVDAVLNHKALSEGDETSRLATVQYWLGQYLLKLINKEIRQHGKLKRAWQRKWDAARRANKKEEQLNKRSKKSSPTREACLDTP